MTTLGKARVKCDAACKEAWEEYTRVLSLIIELRNSKVDLAAAEFKKATIDAVADQAVKNE